MKFERPLQKHEIPRRRERAIVNTLWRDLERLAYDHLRHHHLRRRRLWHVGCAVWAGHLNGKLATAQVIANDLDLPRTTVIRWLDSLVKTGIVGRKGSRYYITDKYMQEVVLPPGRSLFDRQRKLILDAADALRRISVVLLLVVAGWRLFLSFSFCL
jgi:hypothetical protein